MQTLNAEQQWKLISYLVERLNSVLGHIDDSNGDRFGIEALINSHMSRIFSELNWSEQDKAQWMFERLTSYEFDVFPSIEEHFKSVWQHNTHFLDLCREAIEKASKTDDEAWNLRRYAKPLIEQSFDWREVVEIKQKIARTCRDYLEIVDTFIEHKEPLEGEFWLAKAKNIATNYEQEACHQMQFKLYIEQGEIASAWALGNRLFEQSAAFSRYQQLALFKKNYAIEDSGFLARVEQTLKAAYPASQGGRVVFKGLDDLLEFYMEQEEWHKACDWVATRRVSSDVLLKLADSIVDDMPTQTLSYYLRAVVVQIEQTNNDGYAAAIRLLNHVESLLKPHPETLSAFYAKVSSLANTYKRKRNMLKLFQQHYGAYL
ncbi:hypothetical protein Q8W40_18110 [Vibrio penaeicida]|uniref:hypothetical protein n=1 Tax=Vibrio penaeicida TaxID=104609 RepID=UPI0027332CE4|nr:hypothetical protein [Vibrio penaeicida]MDP2574115.1 hypothetical protein [Vibrio penaeicida]